MLSKIYTPPLSDVPHLNAEQPQQTQHLPKPALQSPRRRRSMAPTEAVSHFEKVHGKRRTRSSDHAAPLSLRHLWKPPVIRQWLQDGKLYKETSNRQPFLLDLFLDLAYAGIVHQLAEQAADSATGVGFAKFILVFYPSWSIWKDLRDYSNVSGTDDVKLRLYTLITVILLYGYAANACGIRIVHDEPPLPRELLTARGEHPLEHLHTSRDARFAVQAAVTFYLSSKIIRIFTYIYYAWRLPRFQRALLFSAADVLLLSFFYVPLLWTQGLEALVTLPTLAIAFDLASRYAIAPLRKLIVSNDANTYLDASKAPCIPAINVEHMMDRSTQCVVIVFAEVIMNCIFVASDGEIGLHAETARSALGIVIAFALIWLFFDADSSRTFVHALRRHWFANTLFTQLHFPLTASIILLSASLAEIVEGNEVSTGLLWYFSGGIGGCLLCIAVIGMLHCSLDRHRSGLLPRKVRLGLRVCVALFIAALPTMEPDDTTLFLGIVAIVLVTLVFVETIGKLGCARADDDDGGEASEQMKRTESQQRIEKHWERHKSVLTDAEKGEDDCGIDVELGNVEVREIHAPQKLAYAA